MKTGTFVNYQLAEAILLLHNYQKSNKSLAEFEIELSKLKDKWKKDTIPSTNSLIPNLYIMQDITVDQLIQIDSKINEYNTFSTENTANMQYIIKITNDGNLDFDFSYLDSIVQLAREKGKKVIIDSAVVFGDHFPEIFDSLSRDEITYIIQKYISQLTTKYGDDIERIDVLNSVFERKDIKDKDGTTVEDFWKRIFGDNYGEEIINICKSSLRKNIPLCWNEFYITNKSYADKKDRFLSIVSKIDNLDIIGIQDTFQDSADLEYTIDVLREIEQLCLSSDKKAAITEFGCRLSGKTINELYATLNNNPLQINDHKLMVEQRINKLMETIANYTSQSQSFISVEGRISKEFDFNAYLPELRELHRQGIYVNTVGNNWNQLIVNHNELNKIFENNNKPNLNSNADELISRK